MLPTDTLSEDGEAALRNTPLQRKKRSRVEMREFLSLARERFKQAGEADDKQREREREDIQFYNGDQWSAADKQLRGAQPAIGNVPATGPRPTLVINKVREPVRQVLNDESDSEIGFQLVPADDFGDLGITIDDTEIQLREGLIRRIQREGGATDAITWAFSRATIAGRGYFAVMTRFVQGKTKDKEIYYMRIYNQDAVRMDPGHEEPDGSDAEWEFMGTWMSWQKYKATYPHSARHPNRISGATESDFTEWANGEETKAWIRTEGENRSVYVTDYYYVEYASRELCELANGDLYWADELPDEITADLIVDRLPKVERTVRWAKMDGINDDPLEETDWECPYLPIIKVLGEELHPHDSERRAEGMVRPARDAQRGFNWLISKQVEVIGAAPIQPLIVDPEAIENYEEEYKVAATRPLYALHARSYNADGQPLKEPHRPQADPNILATSQSVAMFDGMISATTMVPPAARGDIDPVTRSGKALKVLTANSKVSTSNFVGNLAKSVRYAAVVTNALLFPIYGQPGRIVRILTGKGSDTSTVMIADPQQQQQDAQLMARAKSVATLTKDARLNVLIKVTRAYEERRAEERAMLGEIFSAMPETFHWYADLFLRDGDGPGHAEMAERAKVMLPPQIQRYLAAKAQGTAPPSPQELQLQSENVQLKQKLQEAGQIIQTKGVEQQGKLEITKVQEAAESERAAKERETKIAVAVINALQKQQGESLQIFYEERARIGDQAAQANLDARQKAHEIAMAAVTGALDARQSAQEHQQTLQQTAHAAAVQPPAAGGQPSA